MQCYWHKEFYCQQYFLHRSGYSTFIVPWSASSPSERGIFKSTMWGNLLSSTCLMRPYRHDCLMSLHSFKDFYIPICYFFVLILLICNNVVLLHLNVQAYIISVALTLSFPIPPFHVLLYFLQNLYIVLYNNTKTLYILLSNRNNNKIIILIILLVSVYFVTSQISLKSESNFLINSYKLSLRYLTTSQKIYIDFRRLLI